MAGIDENNGDASAPSEATFSVTNTASSGRSTGIMVQTVTIKELAAAPAAAPAPSIGVPSEDGIAEVRSASIGTPVKACVQEITADLTPSTPIAGGRS